MKPLIGALLAAVILSVLWYSEADAAQRCIKNAITIPLDLTALPKQEDIQTSSATQLIVGFGLVDADNSVTAVEIEVWTQWYRTVAPYQYYPLTEINSDGAGGWTANIVTLQWDPIAEGKQIVLALPIAYERVRVKVVTATGAGAGDTITPQWNVCGA